MSSQDKARVAEIVRHKKMYRQRAVDFQQKGDFTSSLLNQLLEVELTLENAIIHLNYYSAIDHSQKNYWAKRATLITQQRDDLKNRLDQMNGGTPPPVDHSTSPANSINDIVAKVNATSNKQDTAHNLILQNLLSDKYSAHEMSNNSQEEAYTAIRTNLSGPLFRVRDMSHVNNISLGLSHPDNNTLSRFPNIRTEITNKKVTPLMFIRDFMQVHSAGDITIEDWLIEDQVIQSEFAADFNDYVDEINSQITSTTIQPFSGIAHRDALQIIPNPTLIPDTDIKADQFVGAIMDNVTIQGNVISSIGQLQGIFASDGAFKNLSIKNNYLDIGGEHTISINGLLSGDISGNKDLDGNALPPEKIQLLPLRIGGGAQIYICSFVNQPTTPLSMRYEYEPVQNLSSIVDSRRDVPATIKRNASYYDNVDMFELLKKYSVNHDRSLNSYKVIMRELVNENHADFIAGTP